MGFSSYQTERSIITYIKAISFPESSFPRPEGGKRTALERSDLTSENSGLPVEVRMLDKKTFKRSKMASVEEKL